MKKIITFALTLIMLLTFTSCGETVICDGCEKEVKKHQTRQKEWEEYTLQLCGDCYGLLNDYEKGKAVKCDFCGDFVRKSEAHVNSFLGEPLYICDDCYMDINN